MNYEEARRVRARVIQPPQSFVAGSLEGVLQVEELTAVENCGEDGCQNLHRRPEIHG